MRVLVACECSGRVRDAFIARGHDAISCDLLDTETPGPHHVGDIDAFLMTPGGVYDLVIAFPPCTFLSSATPLNWHPSGERRLQQSAALRLALGLLNVRASIGVCVENSQGLLNRYVRPTQIINPYLFGHPIRKRTCLWLRGLPPLVPSKVVAPDLEASARWWALGGRKGRGHHRSRTFQGIADAMAEQWGSLSQPFLSPLGL